MTTLLQDLRYSLRMLRKSPSFTVIAAVTLALGIGANTAIFSVADALLWKPVALPDLDRLTMALERHEKRNADWNTVAPANYLDWKAQSTVFQGMCFYRWGAASLTSAAGDPERVQSFLVSANFFDVVGVKPALGRAFRPEEEQPGREDVAILGHGLWQRRFAADPAIVGTTVQLDSRTYKVIGVMPKDFVFPLTAELWMPLAFTSQDRTQRQAKMLFPVARLKTGVSQSQAVAEMESIALRLQQQYPNSNKYWSATLIPLHKFIIGDFTEQYTLMLLGAVGFLLLIACANVANLQFARATGRMREVAVRTALGASRWRIVRSLLTESVVISVLGAALGLAIAFWGVDMIRSGMPADVMRFIPGWTKIQVDARALFFTLGVAVLAGIISGLAPALQSSSPNLNATLREGDRGSSAGRARRTLRNALVAVETALAMVLLVGAGLMVKGFSNLLEEDRFMRPETLLTMRINLPESAYKENPRVVAAFDHLVSRFASLPGVQSAAATMSIPYSGFDSSRAITLEGKPAPAPGEQPVAQLQSMSPAYFRTLALPLRKGRELTSQDGPEAPRVVVISERLMRRFFPGEDPVGKRIKFGDVNSKNPWMTIVGVVGDVKQDVFERQPRAVTYVPMAQVPARSMALVIRSSRDPLAIAAAVRAEVRNLDGNLAIYELKTLERVIHEESVGLNYMAVLMGVFGVMALVLSAMGVYALMAYSVTERTHEIGVRIALGARSNHVLSAVMTRASVTMLIGLVVGFGMALALARLLSSLVYGITATDPATFAGNALVLALSATVASYIPARRATKVDPIVALRYE
jgi:putative ABC transport system permease protein